jgi:hypothetical protein
MYLKEDRDEKTIDVEERVETRLMKLFSMSKLRAGKTVAKYFSPVCEDVQLAF